MAAATLTSKGQITVPKEVRDALGVGPGDRVDFVRMEDGNFAVIPAGLPVWTDLSTLSGSIRSNLESAARTSSVRRQATTGANHAARREKLQAEGFIDLWKTAGARLEIWSWAKHGARGQRKTWQLRREAL